MKRMIVFFFLFLHFKCADVFIANFSASPFEYGSSFFDSTLSDSCQIVEVDGVIGFQKTTDTQYEEIVSVLGAGKLFDVPDRICLKYYNLGSSSISFRPYIAFNNTSLKPGDDGVQYYGCDELEIPAQSFGIAKLTIRQFLNMYDSRGFADSFSISSGSSSQNLILQSIWIDTDERWSDTSAPIIDMMSYLGNGTIFFNWTSENDVFIYQIWRNGIYFSSTKKKYYYDRILAPNTEYEYQVRVLTTLWSVSDFSDARTIVTNDFTFSGRVDREKSTKTKEGLLDPFRDLVYLGAFRLPSGQENYDRFEYGGRGMDYNPIDETLSITSHVYSHKVASVHVPKFLVNTSIVEETGRTTYAQDFTDLRPSNFRPVLQLTREGLGYVQPSFEQIVEIHGDAYEWNKKSSLIVHSSDFGSSKQNKGGFCLGDCDDNSAAPYLAYNQMLSSIPGVYQKDFKEDTHLIGQFREGYVTGCIPNILSFNAHQMESLSSESGLDYFHYAELRDSSFDCFVGNNEKHNDEKFNRIQFLKKENFFEMGFLGANLEKVEDPGTFNYSNLISTNDLPEEKTVFKRAVTMSGSKNYGQTWYGYANIDQTLGYGGTTEQAHRNIPDTTPSSNAGSKGYHSTHERPMLLLYDPEDLLNVRDGNLSKEEVAPYAYFDVLPYFFNDWTSSSLRSHAIDNVYGRLFVMEYGCEKFTYEARPCIHVFRIAPLNGDEREEYSWSPSNNNAETNEITAAQVISAVILSIMICCCCSLVLVVTIAILLVLSFVTFSKSSKGEKIDEEMIENEIEVAQDRNNVKDVEKIMEGSTKKNEEKEQEKTQQKSLE